MKPTKLIHYRLGVSRRFPATHPRKGEITEFVDKITLARMRDRNKDFTIRAQSPTGELVPKLHTIRSNKNGTAFERWAKRFEKINAGEAVLELFYWSGSPYNYARDDSKQVVFATLTKDDGIGIQKLEFDPKGILNPFVEDVYIDEVSFIEKTELAKNDGLSLEDFKAWFKGYDLSKPMVIIHFTSFRY